MMYRDSFYFLYPYLRTSTVTVLTHYVVSNDWMIVNNEVERIWKEAATAQSEAFISVFTWSKWGKNENLSQVGRWPNQDLNQASLKYKSELILRE
jgi:hypothetical protein